MWVATSDRTWQRRWHGGQVATITRQMQVNIRPTKRVPFIYHWKLHNASGELIGSQRVKRFDVAVAHADEAAEQLQTATPGGIHGS